MLEKYHNLQPKPRAVRELLGALELIWEDLPLERVNRAIKNFAKRLKRSAGTGGGYIEHKLRITSKFISKQLFEIRLNKILFLLLFVVLRF